MKVTRENLGWDDFFLSSKTITEGDNFSVARVVAEHRGGYRVKNENGEYIARITGKQIFSAKSREDYPAVGDWVRIKELDNEQAVIQDILPRRSIIKRIFGDKNKRGEKSEVQVIATNIDVAFIVQSLGRDFSVNRLERYLAIVKDTGIKPVIIINKIDLISQEELEAKVTEIKNRLVDVEVILTSTVNNEGLDRLKDYVKKGKTYCFLGSSGVGKSSLINKLLGKDNIAVDKISSYSDRGKHVTTKREMHFLENGGIVIDNPGIREVGMTEVGSGISNTFNEITELAGKCKYADCTHTQEPGCAVLIAIEQGTLDKDKHQNFINLQEEMNYLHLEKQEKRKKERSFGKFMKKAKKELKNFSHKEY